MNKRTLALLTLLSATAASAAVTGYVNNPSGNSSDFATAVAGIGATINTSVNFDAHATGALQSNFYSGVTLSGTGQYTTVSSGVGPGQSGSVPPVITGEGPHAASNHLGSGGFGSGSITVTFANAVHGVGLFTIDLWNPTQSVRNTVKIEIFDGPDGTGTSLGSFNSAIGNFQPTNMYFMGALSSDANIRSFVFTSPGTGNDIVSLDDIWYTTEDAGVPEPSTIVLIGAGLAAVALRRRITPAFSR